MTEFYLHIQKGKVSNIKVLANQLAARPDGITRARFDDGNVRSNQMNRYLHGILIPEFRKALNGAGYMVKNDIDCKLIMKNMFLKEYVVNAETGQAIEYTRRTRDLTKEEMSKLFDDVITFCGSELNYSIAYPNEQLTIEV